MTIDGAANGSGRTSQTSHAGGRSCTVCHHAEAAAINAALVAGESARSVAGRYGLSARAVQRHAERHVIEALRAAGTRQTPEQRALAADSLLEQVHALAGEVRELVDSAKERGDDDRQLRALRELRPTLELLGRVTGELAAGGAVNVSVACVSAFGMPEAEVRGIIETHRQSAATSIDQCAADAIELATMERGGCDLTSHSNLAPGTT